ncbi:MFS transporter, SP family, general alpha glucoside:H+ symporter [Cryptococcus neoformans A1-35-8]|nr:MFS transporter, SP family, general alpha glucoside:H+ symporter [Cryptococcus neoformans var. grubii A1-35-8]OXG99942.1 MFS transporter, SP family, general alpha glucoside:H+ symporter [Cryptococcus neoformans var. grubii A5-35-17]
MSGQIVQTTPYNDTAKAGGDLPYNDTAKAEGDVEHIEKAGSVDYKAGAMEAENAEHAMTVLEAVRAYPMACFWAFIMSFCIPTTSS